MTPLCCCSDIAHRRLALQWVERPSLGRLQEVARQRRYAALTSACDDAGVSHLLVGHHLQDQQETFLHRFTRASGIEGLAAMAPSLVLSTSSQPQLHLCRPLLSIPKSRLLSTCHRFDLHHLIDDPSNRNPAFERIRIRDVLGAMQREEEGRKVLAQLAEVQSVVKRVGQDVKQRVSNVFRRWMRVEQPLGVWVIKARVWQVEGEELMVAVLSRLLFIVRGGTYRPINSAVVDLVRRIRRGDLHPLLCAGCVLRPLPGEGQATMPRTLLVTRANTAVEMAVEGGGRMEWDHRYVLHLTPPQGWAAGQWQWLVRALRPTTDLLGRFKVHERRGRALLHHNLPVLVRRKRGPADARGRVEEEVVCIPHLPHLPLAQGLHRWHGWLVKLEQLHSETPEWD